MKVLENILDTIKKDFPVKNTVRGVKATAVSSGYCGLSSTMIKACCCADEDIDKYLVKSARDLAALALSDKIHEASVGIAAMNSLLVVPAEDVKKMNAFQMMKEKGAGKNISVIGHFPVAEDLKGVAGNLWVFEKELRPGDLPESEMSRYLPQSDIVAISGTVMINHTFESIIKMCAPKSVKIILGASAPVSKVLFDFGIDYISGVSVRKTSETIKYISLGCSFRQLAKRGYIEFITLSKR